MSGHAGADAGRTAADVEAAGAGGVTGADVVGAVVTDSVAGGGASGAGGAVTTGGASRAHPNTRARPAQTARDVFIRRSSTNERRLSTAPGPRPGWCGNAPGASPCHPMAARLVTRDRVNPTVTAVVDPAPAQRAMKNLVSGPVFLLASFVLGGCGSYRVLSEAKSGGTLALEGSHESARSKAEGHMRGHCPAGYEVVEEGDAVSPTETAREWRIAYVCTSVADRRTALVAY